MTKKHERGFWNDVADVRGKRSYKPNRKALKGRTAKYLVIDGFQVRTREKFSESNSMKNIVWWI